MSILEHRPTAPPGRLTSRATPVHHWVVLPVVVVVVAYAWFAAGVRTFTAPAELLTFLPGLAVLVLTLLPGARMRGRGGVRGHRATTAPAGRGGLALWAAAAAALIGWELAELFAAPRSGHPTLSSIGDDLMSTHPSRFVGWLIWLLLGWLLVRDLGGRRE